MACVTDCPPTLGVAVICKAPKMNYASKLVRSNLGGRSGHGISEGATRQGERMHCNMEIQGSPITDCSKRISMPQRDPGV